MGWLCQNNNNNNDDDDDKTSCKFSRGIEMCLHCWTEYDADFGGLPGLSEEGVSAGEDFRARGDLSQEVLQVYGVQYYFKVR